MRLSGVFSWLVTLELGLGKNSPEVKCLLIPLYEGLRDVAGAVRRTRLVAYCPNWFLSPFLKTSKLSVFGPGVKHTWFLSGSALLPNVFISKAPVHFRSTSAYTGPMVPLFACFSLAA